MRGRLRARELLEEDRLVAVRRARASVLARPRQAGVAGLAELAAPLAVRVLEPASAARARALREVARDEAAHLLPEGRLIGGVAEVHGTILNRNRTMELLRP